MSARVYRGATIERTPSGGWWRVSALVPGGPWGSYYAHGMADTLAGAREMVREILARAGVERAL